MRYSRRMLDPSRVRAITLDLDDTLWPVWPAIARAEAQLLEWLRERAPATAARYPTPQSLRGVREAMERLRPELRHDLSAMRRESIRHALIESGDDGALAEPAFDVFFEARQQVEFYDDALPVLEALATRYPLVAISNGNADLWRTAAAPFFREALSARGFGVAKPDPRIFEAGARAAGVSIDQVLHVGDDPALDVLGALDAGMQTFWLSREDAAWPHGDARRPHLVARSLEPLLALLG
jgi:putative hydrolase of the HAD superfamily